MPKSPSQKVKVKKDKRCQQIKKWFFLYGKKLNLVLWPNYKCIIGNIPSNSLVKMLLSNTVLNCVYVVFEWTQIREVRNTHDTLLQTYNAGLVPRYFSLAKERIFAYHVSKSKCLYYIVQRGVFKKLDNELYIFSKVCT